MQQKTNPSDARNNLSTKQLQRASGDITESDLSVRKRSNHGDVNSVLGMSL